MQERRRLSRLGLVGGRAWVRRAWLWGLVACAIIAALGYVLPAHRLSASDTFHSNFDDGGPAPLIVLAFAALLVAVLRTRRFGAGFAAGIISAAGALGAVAPVLLTHMFSNVETAYGEDLFAVGILGMLFGGAALLVAEPILYVGQRRALERQDPVFPTARVLA